LYALDPTTGINRSPRALLMGTESVLTAGV
jgi:hypothetical protein